MKGYVLPVLVLTDEQSDLFRLELLNDEDYIEKQKDYTFYRVSVISSNIMRPDNWTNVMSDGENYIVPLPYKKVKDILEKN